VTAPKKSLSETLRERWADWPDAKVRRKMWRERAWCHAWLWGTPALVVAGLWVDWRFLLLTPFTVVFFICDSLTYGALDEELRDRKKVQS
jgi:hypothetical protein